MAQVTESLTIKVSADEVWDVIGAFETMHVWHPAIDATEIFEKDGVTYRRLTLTSGDTIEESIDAHSDEAKRYSYTMTDFGPLPLAAYSASLSVQAISDNETEISFAGAFEPKGVPNFVVSTAVSRIFKAGLDGIGKQFCMQA